MRSSLICRPDDGGGGRGATRSVLGTWVDVIGWDEAVNLVIYWGRQRVSRAVYLCNVHVAVLARFDRDLAGAIETGDLVLPDGAPVAWMQRRLGANSQTRIDGPNFMERVCAAAEHSGLPIYLFGGSPTALESLAKELARRFQGLIIAGVCSPPYRDFTPEENAEFAAAINDSGAAVIFVGLGCPRQELWIARNKLAVKGVMLGVGAAFDFHSKLKPRAPVWMQNAGLEWLHRLRSEPRRLWKRYMITNTYFLFAAAAQLLRCKLNSFFYRADSPDGGDVAARQ